MAKALDIDLSSFDELVGRLDNIPAQMEDLIDGEIEDGCNRIAAQAKQDAPANDGILRNEIRVDRLASMTFQVTSGAVYSAFVEFGTRANVDVPAGLEDYAAQFIGLNPPSSLSAKEAIFEWCRNKGIDEQYWFAIFITLMVKGVKPHPFFFPAVNSILPTIVSRISTVLSGL